MSLIMSGLMVAYAVCLW